VKKEIVKQFEGYDKLLSEIDVTRKYGIDYTVMKGEIERTINLLHPQRIKLRVADITERTSTAKTFRLVPTGGYLPPFQAGQYISLFVDMENIRTSRPYSISSPPSHIGYYDITVKQVENGLVSTYLLSRVKTGDQLESSSPAGHLYYNPLFHDKTMVCIAGGSGITPFMSMIEETVECGLDRSIHLFYGNKSQYDALFHHTLSELSARFENIHYYPVIEDPSPGYQGAVGLITGDLIKTALGDLDNKTFYLCGPQLMYDFCVTELEKLNIPKRRIRKELFGPPIDICSHAGWPGNIKSEDVFNVHINGQKTIKAKAGESLLTAMEKNGLAIKSQCRSGECSFCRTKVTSGKVFQAATAEVRESDRWYGYVHACVTFPISDLEILI